MIFIARIRVLVDVEDDAQASDCLAEAMRPLLRRHAEQSSVVDWAYNRPYSSNYFRPATQAEIDEISEE